MGRSSKRKLSTLDGDDLNSQLNPSYQTSVSGNFVSNSESLETPSRTTSPITSNSIIDQDQQTLYSKKGIDEEAVFSAARALTNLTNDSSESPPSCGLNLELTNGHKKESLTTDRASPGSATSSQVEIKSPRQHPFIAQVTKVSKHPLVANAVKYYDNSKRNYAAFNYAAEIVEKAAIPVVNKIEVNLNERFQARQERNAQKKRKIDEVEVHQETKKRIQFCLHILKLANDRINTLVTEMQERVSSKEAAAKEKRNAAAEEEKSKTEIVTTVKKLIRLISNFRPSALSADEVATESSNESLVTASSQTSEIKNAIRDIILQLPAAFNQSNANQQTNDKVLVFAKESLEMISRLNNVFSEQLTKAEEWIGGNKSTKSEQGETNRTDDALHHDEETLHDDNQDSEKQVVG